jgi:hypothetical protein
MMFPGSVSTYGTVDGSLVTDRRALLYLVVHLSTKKNEQRKNEHEAAGVVGD